MEQWLFANEDVKCGGNKCQVVQHLFGTYAVYTLNKLNAARSGISEKWY